MLEILQQAWLLVWNLDADLLSCVWVSLACSFWSTLAAAIIGVPIGVMLGRRRFLGRKTLIVIVHTGMAVPTVVVGLVFYLLLSRSGPLGEYGLLFSVNAIIIGQFALALPIIISLFSSSAAALDPRLEMTARTLGAGRIRILYTLVGEARVGLVAALMAAFGRICSELGIAMMLGGNIRGFTRTMTTAIALETQKGEFAQALALAVILLIIALAVNAIAQVFRLPSKRESADVI